MAAAGAEAPPLPGRTLRRMLGFLACRLVDAFVYGMCAALFLSSAGSVLSVVARRVGGARLADAAGFIVIAGACLFPSMIVGIPLLAWRGSAAAAKESKDEAPAARLRDDNKEGSILRNLWAGLPRRWRACYILFSPALVGQLMLLFSPVGSFEKAASLLMDVGFVGTALILGCWFAPHMAMEWRTAGREQTSRRVCVSLKNELPV